MNSSHKFAGFNTLGTFLFALTALSAGVGAFIFRKESVVYEAGYGHVVVNNAVVIEFKYSGDIHALGARKAVAAFCAGNSGPLQEGGANPLD